MRKARQSSLYERLAEQSDRLDALMREAAGGFRCQRRFDECESEAQAIGKGIVAAFRAR